MACSGIKVQLALVVRPKLKQHRRDWLYTAGLETGSLLAVFEKTVPRRKPDRRQFQSADVEVPAARTGSIRFEP